MANMTASRLGDVIRDARTKADLTLRDLATKLKLTPSYLSDIENDRRIPSEEVIRQLADALHLRPDDLLAMAGRMGEQAERYLKQHPTAGVLFRRISDKGLKEQELKELLEQVEGMKDREE